MKSVLNSQYIWNGLENNAVFKSTTTVQGVVEGALDRRQNHDEIGKISTLAAVISLIAGFTAPARAQHSVEPGQPIVGGIHVREVMLENALTSNYLSGIIDPLELANMRRDLDGIKVKEESYRMRASGMTPTAEARIHDKLDLFESRLMQKVADKGRIATATYVEVR